MNQNAGGTSTVNAFKMLIERQTVKPPAVRRYWTLPEIARFRRLYPISTRAALMQEFGRSALAIHSMAGKLRLSKDPGVGPRFEKGHKTWNAGKKYRAGGRSVLTQFKKGEKGPRYRPIGTERVTRDGPEIKVAEPRKWISKSRFIWEKAHGPIPAGMVVRIIGGDRLNPTLADLRLLSRGENAVLNSKARKPKRKVIPAWLRAVASDARLSSWAPA